MDIAPCVSRYQLISVCKSKYGFRLFSGLEILSLHSFFSFDGNPSDVMFFYHRMLYFSYEHFYLISILCNYRHVLLYRSIYRTGYKFLHLFTAAYYRHA